MDMASSRLQMAESVGEYVDNRRHGYGVEKSKEGAVLYDGNWAYGEFVGESGDCGSVVDAALR